jgi:ABC-type Mn2+/Zn2+ transport systems, permease components
MNNNQALSLLEWLPMLTSELLLLPLLAGLCIATVAGPLGSFVVWRRMAYFGDTLAHSALLGVAFGVMLNLNLSLAMVAAGIVVSVLLWLMQRQTQIATDSLLGIISHSSLALGLVAVSLMAGSRVNLFGFLFGDLLAVGWQDLIIMAVSCSLCLLLLLRYWRPLLMLSVDADLARVEGLPVERLRLLLMILMAATIALAMKVVGVLLITALLIIPAAAARRVTVSPEAMAFVASIIGAIAVTLGLLMSLIYDTPAGPSIVIMATACFVASMMIGAKRHGGV